MSEDKKKNPNELAVLFAEKYLQGKSYDYIVATARRLISIAESSCMLPTLTKEN